MGEFVRFERGRPSCQSGNAPLCGAGECGDRRRIPPPIFFSVLPKRKRAVDGPKEKNALARTCTFVQVRLKRGSSESVSLFPADLLPVRDIPRQLRGSCAAVASLADISGWSSQGPPSWPRCRYPGDYRGSSATTGAAPAERGHKSIWAFPGLTGFPKGLTFHSNPKHGMANLLPPAAGGTRPARTDPPRRFFLLDRPRPVLFLSRTKREWGVECSGHRRTPRAAKRRLPPPPPQKGFKFYETLVRALRQRHRRPCK